MKHSREMCGFTLIELLVVLTVVGFLTALLFPVFAKVRESGHRTTCLSNERQLGLGIIQYTADYDFFFPNDQTPDSAGLWALQIFPYLRNPSVYRCPDETTTDSDLGKTHYSVDSYGINLNLLENVRFNPVQGVVEAVKPNVSEAVLTAPARTTLLFEVTGDTAALSLPKNLHLGCAASGNGSRNPSTPGFPWAAGCRPEGNLVAFSTFYATGAIGGRIMALDSAGAYSSGIETVAPRHNGGANYVACDGHVVWLRPSRVSGGQSQPVGGANCGQDEMAPACGGSNTAAGSVSGRYDLTFSVR